jgi:hypothetical protein
MDSPRIRAKKERYLQTLKTPGTEYIWNVECDLGNLRWFETAQMLLSDNPELQVLANIWLRTPVHTDYFAEDGSLILFTDEDDPDPDSPNAAI